MAELLPQHEAPTAACTDEAEHSALSTACGDSFKLMVCCLLQSPRVLAYMEIDWEHLFLQADERSINAFTVGGSALHFATARGNLAAMRLLLQRNTPTDISCFGYGLVFNTTKTNRRPGLSLRCIGTPLHWGICMGRHKAVQLLIHYGADVHADVYKGVVGFGALHLAASRSVAKMVKLLLDHGYDADGPKTLRDTPLIMASFTGREDNVRLLMSSGCEVDAVRYSRITALVAATIGGHAVIIKFC